MKKNTTEILKQSILTERDIKLLCRRANASDTREEVMNIIGDFNKSYDITADQSVKGFAWLNNKRMTSRGVERKNNPFGYREEQSLDTFEHINFDGLYDAGNRYFPYFVPVYIVHGTKSSFQYVVVGGEIRIIG